MFQGHQDWVLSCAFSPDGTQALSAGIDRTLRLWEVNTGTGKTFMLHSHQATAAWQVSTGALLHASGRAWRYLRWQRLDTQGRTQVWPLEPELTTVL